MIPPVADPQVSPGERHVYDQCLAEVIERAAAAAESAKPAGYAHSEITLLSPRAHGSASQTLSGKWASRMRSAAAAGRRKVPAHDSSRIQGTGVPCRHRDRYRQS